jgi:hypothetical protein
MTGRAIAQERYPAEMLVPKRDLTSEAAVAPVAVAALMEQYPVQLLVQQDLPVSPPSAGADGVSPAQALMQPTTSAPAQSFFEIADDSREKWYVYGGTVFMHRSAPAPGPLIFANAGFVPPTLLDASNMNFGWAFGFDAGGIYSINDHWSAELRYFQVDPWTSSFNSGPVPAVSILFQGFGNGFAGGAGTFGAAPYSSLLRSAESNVRYASNSWWTVLAGFRYVNLDESLNVQEGFVGAPPAATFNSYTSNHLFGGQIGFEGLLYNSRRLSLDTYVKAGVYGTYAYTSPSTPNFVGFGVFTPASQGQVSFLGDGGMRAALRLTSWASLEGSYQLMWLTGVALASDQFNAGPSGGPFAPPTINSKGFVFYQGLTLGLKIQH